MHDMHHLLIPLMLAGGWIALPSRKTRLRFVAILAAAFIAGAVLSPIGRGLARGMATMIVFSQQPTCQDAVPNRGS
jgi:hypothetical protein